jgi:hypothetical protein
MQAGPPPSPIGVGRRGAIAASLAAAGFALLASPALADGLEVSPAVSRDGVYQLRWPAGAEGVVEESATAAFDQSRVLYEGSDHAVTVSGRPDGAWYYRLRPHVATPGESPVVRVNVEHHSLARALGFFLVGLVVFVATVGLVVRGTGEGDASGDSGGARG